MVRDAETGAWIADLVAAGDSLIIARGGKGGKGNEHFKSSTRRTPRVATRGKEGQSLELLLELRLLADVGLVGLPNVGKSTLLARVSNARPRIGAYPFTTLAPNLGIVPIGESFSLVMADIPGLVEGAHEGRGLGIRFLKHVERTRILLFLLDCMSEAPEVDLRTLRREIARFSPSLSRRPALVAFSKADLRGSDWEAPEVAGAIPPSFSSHTGQGIDSLLGCLRTLLEQSGAQETRSGPDVEEAADSWTPFAIRVDQGEDLGPRPWPRRKIAEPVRPHGASGPDG
jgi:GTP-binding protein